MTSPIAFSPREREQSILDQLPQVRLLAWRLYQRCPSTVLLEDLESAGVTGLIHVADRYDRRRNIKFKTLAEHRIRGAMLDYLRSLDPLPRAVRRFVRDRDTVIAQLEHHGDCCASEEDIVATMGMSIERYRRLLEIAQSADIKRLGQQDNVRASTAANPCATAALREVDDAIQALPAYERSVILALRDGHSLTEIANRIDVTPGRVSQIKKQAIIRLQIALGVAPANQHSSARKTRATERAS
jgi:RNA polymerase sigma factor FliA